MNTDKARRLLKKIQALFDNVSDQTNVSSLERDLLLNYLREFYEEVSSPETIMKEAQDKTTGKEFYTPERKNQKTETPVWTEPEKPIVAEPVHTKVEQPVMHIQHPVESTIPIEEVKKAPPVVEQTMTVPDETLAELNGLFEYEYLGELAERLKLQPLDRIEHGMGISERIHTVNELFGGDNDVFKKTIERLNEIQSFHAAQDYLTGGVAAKYNWADAERKSKASHFIHLVRRKYVVR
jgi:hypothetical protein